MLEKTVDAENSIGGNFYINCNNINKQKPLTQKHNDGAVLMFEQHGKWRICSENFIDTRQSQLSENEATACKQSRLCRNLGTNRSL